MQEVVQVGDVAAFEALVRRYNARLFRVARAIVQDDDEAEDVVQEAYVRAWTKLEQFEGRSSFATWLTRIAVHEALARKARRAREAARGGASVVDDVRDAGPGPQELATRREAARLLERAIDDLPEPYRVVYVLREVQGLSGAETADALELTEGAVKVRLHRARAALRRALEARPSEAFSFDGARCDRLTARTMLRLTALQGRGTLEA
jgi:RNA polymerase sigma-70 factor, ECF subfamily